MNNRSPLMALGHPALTLSPQVGRGDTPSPVLAGEGWGEGGAVQFRNHHLFSRAPTYTRLTYALNNP